VQCLKKNPCGIRASIARSRAQEAREYGKLHPDLGNEEKGIVKKCAGTRVVWVRILLD
jgi:hypothetical protein